MSQSSRQASELLGHALGTSSPASAAATAVAPGMSPRGYPSASELRQTALYHARRKSMQDESKASHTAIPNPADSKPPSQIPRVPRNRNSIHRIRSSCQQGQGRHGQSGCHLPAWLGQARFWASGVSGPRWILPPHGRSERQLPAVRSAASVLARPVVTPSEDIAWQEGAPPEARVNSQATLGQVRASVS